MIPTLRFLSERRFASFVRWLAGTGEAQDEAGCEATCIINLRHPDKPRARPYYVKFYPDLASRSRGLFNESVAYVMAHHLSLPQPPTACIMRVPLKRLQLDVLPKHHAWLRDLARKTKFYPAFCTEAVNVPTPWLHYGAAAADAMRADLLNWPEHLKTLAFDDIIANLDRHLNNLLRMGDSRYALIDHGRLVAGDGHWQAGHLDPDGKFTNRLLGLLYADPALAANGMVAAADSAILLLSGMAEVRQWADALIPDAADRTAFHSFLQARTIGASKRIAARYALC